MSGRFPVETPSKDALQQYRADTGVGLTDAKKELRRQAEIASLTELVRSGTLEDRIDWLIARYAESLGMKLEDIEVAQDILREDSPTP